MSRLNPQTVVMATFVVLWYTTSSLNAYSIKAAYDDGSGVLELLILQFFLSFLLGLAYVGPSLGLQFLSYDTTTAVCGALHAAGSLATLLSLRILRPSLVQLSKSVEPVFSVVIALLVGFPVNLKVQLATSIAIAAGIAISAYSEVLELCWESESFTAFALALTSGLWCV